MPDTKNSAVRLNKTFEKRVKRRVTGQAREFFAVCAPGLEQLCKNELSGLLPKISKVTETLGGIEFTARLPDIYQANLHLNTPSRILMRIESFKATGFADLERRLQQVDWELFLPPSAPVNCRVSVQKCRLYHSNAIALRVLSCLPAGNRHDRDSSSPDMEQTLFVRGQNDRFVVSLDTSGPPLYKRGIKKTVVSAPIRENLAWAVLTLAGFDRDDVLVDPMCGSGTFSLEAARIKAGIPPGFFRQFAFESWPAFNPARLAHLKSLAEQDFSLSNNCTILASDHEASAVAALEKNIESFEFARRINARQADFFDISPPSGPAGTIVLNPPYGKRLKQAGGVRKFYRQIGTKLKADFSGYRLGIVLPSRTLAKHLGMKLKLTSVFHGGATVYIGTGRIEP